MTGKVDKTFFIVPDLQIPLHDEGFVYTLAECIRDHKRKHDEVITIGDELDFTSLGRWSEGTPLAYTRQLGTERDEWVEIAKALQVTSCIRSNHTDRLFATIMRKAPGLLDIPELELPAFMRLDQLGITWHPKGYNFAPHAWALHGDEAGLSQIAGTTARKLADKVGGKLTVCGHTHRLGLQPFTRGVNGTGLETSWAIETGHAMDTSKAHYAKTHNWQQGFTVIERVGNSLHPQVVPVVNRSFVYAQQEYRW